LDVRDTVAKWMEGRVVQVDPKKGYFVNYLGWSEKVRHTHSTSPVGSDVASQFAD
jgi:hypothetical protein